MGFTITTMCFHLSLMFSPTPRWSAVSSEFYRKKANPNPVKVLLYLANTLPVPPVHAKVPVQLSKKILISYIILLALPWNLPCFMELSTKIDMDIYRYIAYGIVGDTKQ